MADIKIERQHELGRTEARRRVVELEPKLKDKYGVTFAWNGEGAQLKGTGVSGTLRIDDREVAIDLKLALLLKPMASKIKDSLARQIDRALG